CVEPRREDLRSPRPHFHHRHHGHHRGLRSYNAHPRARCLEQHSLTQHRLSTTDARSREPDKPLRSACDSSEYGIGAVLPHVMSDKSERPILFISKILTATEKNYVMVCKEALKLRDSLLAELHSTHEGLSKMKANARAYFWWLSLDADIERVQL
ncbi:hypothetical protein ILUMI_17078, partial [Ignelater luminosus]